MVNLGLRGLSSRSSSTTRIPSATSNADIPTLLLRIVAISGRDLIAKDKGGTSDPYLSLNINDSRFVTQTVSKNLNPVWNATFETTLNADNSTYSIELICWDKDRFKKDYMGEFEISLNEVFASPASVNTNETKWFTLQNGRKKSSKVSGEIGLSFALSDPANSNASNDEVYAQWLKFVQFADNTNFMYRQQEVGVPKSDIDGSVESTLADLNINVEGDSAAEGTDATEDEGGKKSSSVTKKRLRMKRKKSTPYKFAATQSEVLGVVFLEVKKVNDLPPEKNTLRTGFDMDPFVIMSFGKNVFRTRVIRHSLNPVFNERLLFRVLKHEQNYGINFRVCDRDTLSNNDFVAQTTFPVNDLIEEAPQADEDGIYKIESPSDSDSELGKSKRPKAPSRAGSASNIAKRLGLSHRKESSIDKTAQSLDISGSDLATAESGIDASDGLKSFTIPLTLARKDQWEDKHKPEMAIEAKYVPYAALRQQFWRCLLRHYDADDSGRISRVELVTMLDSLGSTLTDSTVDGFFTRFTNKAIADVKEDTELTYNQAIVCLEDQLKLHGNHLTAEPSLSQTPSETSDESGSSAEEGRDLDVKHHGELPQVIKGPSHPTNNEDLADPENNTEHVIMINECPLCHQPRLNKRSEVDIITHIATCASQDWRRVDRIVMGNFVTSSQAQRKWYNKIISKVAYGGYKVGANSANTLVQDRITGQINEEKMSVYVRLGIRLLYKGLKSSRMEQKKIRGLLKSLSEKQGRKYDNPASAKDIKPFIAFHQLDMNEVLLPLEEFKNFNEFFYRKLKGDARPCTAADDQSIAVSPADCRSVVFDTIDLATKIWVKGKDFGLERLFGDAYPDDVKRFNGGALGIFRLAPQDYHRFHIPVDGILGEPKLIEGQYYTVNPMAIRSGLDVYGENIRVLVPIDSAKHGRVMVICVGAMMVGSTVITAKAGQKVNRTDELGYFKFGGSTILLLFEPGKFKFDDDLVDNSNTSLETLLRVGQSIGHIPGQSNWAPKTEKKEKPTAADLEAAAVRIGGGGTAPSKLT